MIEHEQATAALHCRRHSQYLKLVSKFIPVNCPHPGNLSTPGATACGNTSCSRTLRLLEQLNIQRQNSLFCDVLVRIPGSCHSFPAHRCVLAASSPKLHSLAVTAVSSYSVANSVIVLDSLTVVGFQPVLDFIYTGRLSLTIDNIQEVYAAACYLELSDVVKCCENALNGEFLPDRASDSTLHGSNSNTESSKTCFPCCINQLSTGNVILNT